MKRTLLGARDGLNHCLRHLTFSLWQSLPTSVQSPWRELEVGGGHPILPGHRYRSKKYVFNKSPKRPMEHPNIPVFPSHKEPHCWLQKESGVSSNHFT